MVAWAADGVWAVGRWVQMDFDARIQGLVLSALGLHAVLERMRSCDDRTPGLVRVRVRVRV